MKNTLQLFVVIFFCTVSSLSAQRPVVSLDFITRFDNREYSSDFATDQTLFGMKIRPQAGLNWINDHYLVVGGDFTLDFGGHGHNDPELLFYYMYRSDRLRGYAGIFPRERTFGDYPAAFFSDSVRFYDANLEGFLVQYTGRNGYVELGLDWNSMISHTHREKFMIFSSARYHYRSFYGGYFASLYHFAGTLDVSGVVDNLLLYPHVGYNYRHERWRRPFSLEVRAGWIQAMQRDRENENEFKSPGGFQLETTVKWHTLGLNNTFYAGDGLMPYYFRYGPQLYFGESFYRTDRNIYDRLEIYWQPVSTRMFDLRISSVHHYDGNGWGWQQLLTFRVSLASRNFRQ